MRRHFMKKQSFIIVFLLVLLVLNVSCLGQQTQSTVAPMEKTEKETLYSTIQGFVGNWWNGSDLYPDPCGWTPIQGVDCDVVDGLWYVTGLSIGPIHDNYPSCTEDSEFRSHLFEFKHLKTLSFYNCFVSPNNHGKSISSLNWGKLGGTLESLEFRENPGLTERIPQGFGEIMQLQSLVLLENGLSGALPINLGNLVSLRRLVIAGNRFTGEIPASLSYLNIDSGTKLDTDESVGKTSGSAAVRLKASVFCCTFDGSLWEFGRQKMVVALLLMGFRFIL
ncbi:piriformospora indica-insensitive protein 2-like [Papaver somniferum]|uniref:piriformospora indica-insensitive protein 2-like n=1 Tax=Papaver somniferum TaxID=3469 RepID=UPI000E6F6688|nr:piriformospora indica-insensitive protein 2-like [Papaver somniferum]